MGSTLGLTKIEVLTLKILSTTRMAIYIQELSKQLKSKIILAKSSSFGFCDGLVGKYIYEGASEINICQKRVKSMVIDYPDTTIEQIVNPLAVTVMETIGIFNKTLLLLVWWRRRSSG
ncbi:hypothetical protein TNCV_3343551 [Trichonephila clavipes]|nr:hypothetical protein TNCV_3343551 [Trichonephila clavipes]